jgi:hypothetical protein
MKCTHCGKETDPIEPNKPVQNDSVITVKDEKTPPNATPHIVLSVVNIVLCGSSIFGIIALVFALLATNEKNEEEAFRQLRISMILNIIGISLGVVAVILAFLYIFFVFGIMGFAFLIA